MPPAPMEPRLAPEPRVREPSRSMAETVERLVTNETPLPLGAYPKLVTRDMDVAGIDPIEGHCAHGGHAALGQAPGPVPPDHPGVGGQRSRRRGRGRAGISSRPQRGRLAPG